MSNRSTMSTACRPARLRASAPGAGSSSTSAEAERDRLAARRRETLLSRLIAIGSTTRRNRIGRAFSLWLTAREAGLPFRYIGIDDGPLWEPLREHEEFRADVRVASGIPDLERQVAAETGPDAVLMICKPRPELLSLGRRLGRSVPVIVDIDDPELEVGWGTTKLRSRAALVARYGPSRFRFGWARRVVKRMNVITSSPVLQSRYGGEVVPHVREAIPPSSVREPDAAPFTVGFIGTPRSYKGIEEVRAAVAELATEREVRVCITASPPGDALPWEEWVGATSLQAGIRLLDSCDAVAIVSQPGPWGDLQVPVKLIDAMHASVPAVITPRPPLLWAAGGACVVVPDGCVSEISKALRLIADDCSLAQALRSAARRRALSTFTPAAAAPQLLAAIDHAGADHRRTRD
jgi:glycosyltransferase involved in cell wall biosynthesis